MSRPESSEPVGGTPRDGARPARVPIREDPISGYFVAQEHRPGELWDVDVLALRPYHRALLINDGTVTQLIEASVLEPLAVDVVDQRDVEADDRGAMWLDLPGAATSVVRRRVVISGRQSGTLHALAESLLVTSRLASAFVSSLSDSPKGLGEVIDQLRLETRRELLWFGWATAPGWGEPAAAAPLLTRSYRIIVGGSPAILVAESFPLTDPTAAAPPAEPPATETA